MCYFSVLLLLLSVGGLEAISFVPLNTTFGPISGVKDQFESFLGVPYAVVDEDDPYGPASPRPDFETLFEAYNQTICPQIVNGSAAGNIQCLTLNIYTDSEVRTGRYYPVIVFIHGGEFKNGDGNSWNPSWLVKRGSVVVTINYRLGPFGFLCVPDTEYTNQGLKDQEIALKWVKKNIKNFGGDDERILLFGHSAGAASVDYHVLYNNENNKLFRRAIIQSGHAASPFIFTDKTSPTLLNKIGFQTNSRPDVYSIIEITKNSRFGPCIDDNYITRIPKVTSLRDMEIIVGTTDLEMFFVLGNLSKTFFENYDISSTLGTAFRDVATVEDVIERIKYEYDINTNPDKIIEFSSDFGFVYPMERSIRYYLDKGATVRRYLFSYMGGRNYMKNREHLASNVTTHADELGYIFEQETGALVGEDAEVVDMMLSMWLYFAKYEYPDYSKSIPKWTPTTANNREYLHIRNASLTMMSSSPQAHTKLWDSIYDQNYHYFKGIDIRVYAFDYTLLGICISIFVVFLIISAVAYRCNRHRHQKWEPCKVNIH